MADLPLRRPRRPASGPSRPRRPPDVAARAASRVDLDALPRTGTGEAVLLWRDEHSEGWLNTWWESRDTGYHDHDGSCVGVHVLAGRASNEALVVGTERDVRAYGAGESFSFPGSGIHRMDHDAGAVTIHVYSPPLAAHRRVRARRRPAAARVVLAGRAVAAEPGAARGAVPHRRGLRKTPTAAGIRGGRVGWSGLARVPGAGWLSRGRGLTLAIVVLTVRRRRPWRRARAGGCDPAESSRDPG